VKCDDTEISFTSKVLSSHSPQPLGWGFSVIGLPNHFNGFVGSFDGQLKRSKSREVASSNEHFRRREMLLNLAPRKTIKMIPNSG
jgi:hypothetical protein